MHVLVYFINVNRLNNTEAPEEASVKTTEIQHKLTCNIDNENNPISYLQDGIKLSLFGSVTKNCPTLGRDAVYNKVMQISKLVSIHSNIIARLSNCTFRSLLLEKG